MPTLPEELLLATYNLEERQAPATPSLAVGVAGAALLDLHLRDRLLFGEKSMEAVGRGETGAWFLDRFLLNVAGSKPRNLQETVSALADEADALLPTLLDQLTAGPDVSAAVHSARARLRRVVLDGHPAEERSLALVGVIHACLLSKFAFPPDRRREARERVEALLSDDMAPALTVEPARLEAIRAVTDAVTTVIAIRLF